MIDTVVRFAFRNRQPNDDSSQGLVFCYKPFNQQPKTIRAAKTSNQKPVFKSYSY